MKAQKYLELLRQIKDTAIATVDAKGRPQVRIIDIMIVREEKLYFVCSRGKDFYREIIQNPNIAITAMTKDWRAIRISGTAQKAGSSLLTEVFAENPSMNDVYPGKSRDILDVFCVSEGSGEVFDLSAHPIYRESFAFGGAEIRLKGFEIDDDCTQCGLCAESCPQKCIDAGSPYAIRQQNCLHCGLCSELCPAGAVKRRSGKQE